MSFVCEFWKVFWRRLRLFQEHKYHTAGSRCSLDLRAANPNAPSVKRHSSTFKLLLHCVLRLLSKLHYLNVAHGKSTACSFNLTLTGKAVLFSTNREVRFSCHLTDTLNCWPPVRDFISKSSHGKIMYLSLHISSQHIIAVRERRLVSWSAVGPFSPETRWGFWRFGSFFTADQSEGDILKELQTWCSCFFTFSLHKDRWRKVLLPNVPSPNLSNITALCSGLRTKKH